MQAREKVEKSRNTIFPMFHGSGGSKSRLAKARVRSQLARGEMKNCTPLWREADFEVKIHKTLHCRSTFRSCDAMWKKCTPMWRQAHCEVKMRKTPQHRFKKSTQLWRGAISKSKCTKHYMLGPLLDVEASFCVAGARDSAPC